MRKIMVTGATGRVGGAVVEALLAAGADVRAGSRDPRRLTVPDQVEVVGIDLSRPETLEPALRGVSGVFLYAVPDGVEAFVAAAEAAGVDHVVLLSSHSGSEVATIPARRPIAEMHETVERALAASGIPHTFLRPAHFASNVLLWGWGEMIRADGVVRFPYPESHCDAVHELDVAAVAATALTEPGHQDREYFLTGPASITQREQAELIGSAIGRTVVFEETTPRDARAELAAHVPQWVLDATFAYWEASDGVPAEVTDVVADLVGRPARTFREWAQDHAADFAPPPRDTDRDRHDPDGTVDDPGRDSPLPCPDRR